MSRSRQDVRDQPDWSAADYARLLRRRWLLIAVPVIGSIVVSLGLAIRETPTYSASAEILVEPRNADAVFGTQVASLSQRAIATELRVVEGQRVREQVRTDLGSESLPPPISARANGSADTLTVTLTSTDPASAERLANAYAQAYVDVRRQQAVDQLLAASSEVRSAIEELDRQIARLDQDDPERTELIVQAAGFRTTLDQIEVDAALRSGGATIIRSADRPTEPISPRPVRSMSIAGLVGLVIGITIAFAVDLFDDRVRSEDDLERASRQAVLARVPKMPTGDGRPLALTRPDHPAAEVFRSLRTSIQFLGLDRPMRVIQVTSALPGEGKTTLATNLAVVLAQAGHSVAMVDADLRRPRVHQVFDVPSDDGVTSMLLSRFAPEAGTTLEPPVGASLTVFSSGPIPSNPSEMLSSLRMGDLLDVMAEHYDYVVVDSPPVLNVTDAIALSRWVHGVVVVAQAGRTNGSDIGETIESLERVSAPVLGAVLNQAKSNGMGPYGFGGYGNDVPIVTVSATDRPSTDRPAVRAMTGPRS